jgi:hypothetical protein
MYQDAETMLTQLMQQTNKLYSNKNIKIFKQFHNSLNRDAQPTFKLDPIDPYSSQRPYPNFNHLGSS